MCFYNHRRAGSEDWQQLADPMLCEDPWDIVARSKTIAQPVLRNTLWLPIAGILLWALVALLLSSSVLAQSPPVPTEDLIDSPREAMPRLSRDALELAQDYVALLEQLEFLTDDYYGYYAELDKSQAQIYAKALRRIARQLQDSASFGDYARFMAGLSTLQAELKAHEDDLKARQLEKMSRKDGLREFEKQLRELQDEEREADVTYESVNPRLYRLTRSLRRELEVINDLFELDVAQRLEQDSEVRELVQAYVKRKVAARHDSMRQRLHTIVISMSDEPDGIVGPIVIDMHAHLPDIPDLPDIPELPDMTDMLETPEVPEMPSFAPLRGSEMDVVARKIIYTHESGEVELFVELVDSIDVSSDAIPIYIVNPIGELHVTGFDHDRIVARCEFEVVAGSQKEVEALIERIDLRLCERKNAVYVEAVVPNLTDPKTRVLSNSVEIKAPRNNSLIVSNSFGSVTVSRFSNGLKLNACNSEVSLSNLEGPIEANNSMGRMDITGATGSLNVRNAYGPLYVSECEGQMEIENAFSAIELTNSEGKAVIRNSGSIKVNGFSGTLDINNSNGSLHVKDLDGDLIAQNSLQPLIIENVSGFATLVNVRGKIVAEGISGTLTATNSFGTISAKSLLGPVHLINQNGVINLALDQLAQGKSFVSSDYGTVMLHVGHEPDLLLTVETVGGNIESSVPISVEKAGSTSSARLTLGLGRASLSVTGTNTNVIIRESE